MMSERMKALNFVVYELFNKNCKRCNRHFAHFCIKFLVLSPRGGRVSTQSTGRESLDQEGYGQETQKVLFFVNCVKRYFWTNLCFKVVLQFLEGKLFSPVLISINKRKNFCVVILAQTNFSLKGQIILCLKQYVYRQAL